MRMMRSMRTAGWLIGLLACSVGAPGFAQDVTGDPVERHEDATYEVAATDHFELRSDPRVALHHFLLDWALADAGEWPPYAPPILEREAWRDSVSAEEARTWSASVAVYDAARGRSLLFDRGMVAVRDWAAGSAPRTSIRPEDRALADALEAALPVYLRRWWPVHDGWNRRWIEAVEPTLDEVEEAVIPRLEAAYGGTWPSGRIPVDVVVHANAVGAYSVGGRVTISSWNRDIVMPHAVDLVFHETSHLASLEGPLTSAIDAAFRVSGAQPPEGLWHDAIFFTTGEILRLVFEERGSSDFRPYAEAAGVYARGERWAVQLPAFREHWLPFLKSRSSDPVARREALEALARALPAN